MTDWLAASLMILWGLLMIKFSERFIRFLDSKFEDWRPWLSKIIHYDSKTWKPWSGSLKLNMLAAKALGAGFTIVGLAGLVVLAAGN